MKVVFLKQQHIGSGGRPNATSSSPPHQLHSQHLSNCISMPNPLSKPWQSNVLKTTENYPATIQTTLATVSATTKNTCNISMI